MAAPSDFLSRWQQVGALRLHALVFADPTYPPAVLLPGLVTASRSMVPLARALRQYRLRPWILDLPGFGYSDKPTRALGLNEQADIVADWLHAVGLAPARLLGNSFGSQLAATVAAAHPDAVARLVLVAPTVGPAVRRRMAWLRTLPGPTGSANRTTGRARASLLGRLHDLLGDRPPLRVLNLAEYGCASLARAVSSVRCAVFEQLDQALPQVSAPTLLLRADHDRLSSLEWAQRLAELPGDARLVQLPDLGHAAFYGAADTVAGIAGPFLADG